MTIETELRAKQKLEALKHIDILTSTFHLRQHMKLSCLNDRPEISVDCSNAREVFVIHQPIDKDYRAPGFVQKFEYLFGTYVYHVIDGISHLILLHVSHNKDAWESLRPVLGCKKVYAAAIDTLTGNVEFGFVELKARQGTLLWVDPFFEE